MNIEKVPNLRLRKYLIMVNATMTMNTLSDCRSLMIVLFINSCRSLYFLINSEANKYDNFLMYRFGC